MESTWEVKGVSVAHWGTPADTDHKVFALLSFALFLLLRSRQGKLPVELSTPGRRPHEFPSSLSLSYFQGQQFQKTINKPQALQSVSEHQTVPSPG